MRWSRLPVGAIKPRGWLQTQAQLQAGALTSHLPLFWADVANSSWLGGTADNVGGIHESAPYWLNGATPLAFQLEDPTLRSVVERYIQGIIARQEPDGWLGPGQDAWSRFPMLLALAQYHEALPQGPDRRLVLRAALRCLGAMKDRMDNRTLSLQTWSAARAHDFIWAIHYFHDALVADPQHALDVPAACDLLALARLAHQQGSDWHGQWYNSSKFPRRSVSQHETNMFSHGVNNAQAVKHGAVWSRQADDANASVDMSRHAWKTLMRYHGQPHGAFAADEHLAGRSPSRGTELCLVVEAMWSMELLAQAAHADGLATWALDAVEGLAFNALPGSLSADLWSHPYLQFPNSFQAKKGEESHPWLNDGPDAAMYGLAPNYECCTANFHQGYPKLISHLFFVEPASNTLISAVWAPCVVSAPHVGGGVQVELRTEYPFGLRADYVVSNPEAFTLKVRLPAFLREEAGLATVRVWLQAKKQRVELVDGFLKYSIPPSPLEPRLALRLEWATELVVRPSDVPEQGVSAFLGPMLLALDLGEKRELVRRYSFEAADWNTNATLAWRRALAQDSTPSAPGPVAWRSPGQLPYARGAAACPVAINATVARLTNDAWPMVNGGPGKLPAPGAALPERRTLVPYGCTSLRVSAFPIWRADESTIV